MASFFIVNALKRIAISKGKLNAITFKSEKEQPRKDQRNKAEKSDSIIGSNTKIDDLIALNLQNFIINVSLTLTKQLTLHNTMVISDRKSSKYIHIKLSQNI